MAAGVGRNLEATLGMTSKLLVRDCTARYIRAVCKSVPGQSQVSYRFFASGRGRHGCLWTHPFERAIKSRGSHESEARTLWVKPSDTCWRWSASDQLDSLVAPIALYPVHDGIGEVLILQTGVLRMHIPPSL